MYLQIDFSVIATHNNLRLLFGSSLSNKSVDFLASNPASGRIATPERVTRWLCHRAFVTHCTGKAGGIDSAP